MNTGAIENLDLRSEVKALQRELEQSRRELETLRDWQRIAQRLISVRSDVSAAFAKPAPIKTILRECTEAIVRNLDAAFARIWTLNHQENVLELKASGGMYTRLDGEYSRIPAGSLKLGWIIREKKPLMTNSVLSDPHIHNKQWALDCGLVSYAGYPLIVEGRVIGVMAMFARHPLCEATLDTLAAVADVIAQGIERDRAESELRVSENQFRTIVDTIPGMICTLNPAGQVKLLSRQVLEYFGKTAQELKNWTMSDAVHPEDLPQVMERWKQSIQSGEAFDSEQRQRRADGVYRWQHSRALPARDDQGTIIAWYMLITDIHDRRQAVEALRRSQAYLTAAQQLSRTGSFGWKPGTDEIIWSEETFRIMGYDPGLRPTMAMVFERLHPQDASLVKETMDRAVRNLSDFELEHRLLFADGAIKHVQVVARAAKDIGGDLEYVGALMDITERQHSREALEKALLSRQTAVLAERNRLARDIHDTLAQGFTGVIVQLEAAEDATSQGLGSEAMEHVRRAGLLARESLREARRSVRGLRPQALDEQDLCEALDTLLGKMTVGTALKATLSVAGRMPLLPPDWEEHLLRISQEVLTNALRHARATEFAVRLASEATGIRLELRDNGCGFDFAGKHDGFGLIGICERVEGMGGEFSLNSTAGKGTLILITLPLNIGS